ncbi:MFS family permease [Phycisphaera mikurensis]|nr:MFS family permease [Phycisphaera mikurensis]
MMLGLAAALVVGTCVGQSFLLGQFKEPMQASLGIDGTRMALLYFVATLAGGLSLWPAGLAVDRLGLRRVCLLVLPALALSCWTTALAPSVAVLLAGILCLRMLGQGVMELLSGNTVAMWYHRRLGIASTVTSVAFALSLLVLPPLVQASIAAVGWRWTYGICGGAILACWPIVWLAFVGRPEEMGQAPDGVRRPPAAPTADAQRAAGLRGESLNVRQALRTRSFWILTVALAHYALALTAAVFCVNSVVKERGLPEEQGAWVISALGGAMAASYPVLGPLADRLHARWLQAFATLALCGAMIGLAATSRPRHLVLVGAALGVCISAQAAVGATAWVRRYGRDHLGSIRGVVQTTAVAGSSVGPLVLEALADGLASVPSVHAAAGGRYTAALWILAGVGVPVAAMAMLLRGGEAGVQTDPQDPNAGSRPRAPRTRPDTEQAADRRPL